MIDVAQIIHSHTGMQLPGCILLPLRRLLHQRDVNRLLESGEGLSPRDFLRHSLDELQIEREVHYSAPLAVDERYIFVSNHPFGALDGMVLAAELLHRWEDVGVVASDVLMHLSPLGQLWIAVNRFRSQNASTCESYNAALASPTKQILTFPAGLCSRLSDGRVEDLRWHHRFVRDAERYGRRVVPIYVEGRLSQRFYGLHRLRQRLGVRVNVELLLLVDELFRQRGSRVRIEVGPSVDVRTLAGSAIERCGLIREMVYSMRRG